MVTRVEYGDRIEWYNEAGQCHRDDGPAIEFTNGTRKWLRNGLCHRDDGPAVERANGDRLWYQNGQLHRSYGPAVEWGNGKYEYWLNGEQVSDSEIGLWRFIDIGEEFQGLPRTAQNVTLGEIKTGMETGTERWC